MLRLATTLVLCGLCLAASSCESREEKSAALPGFMDEAPLLAKLQGATGPVPAAEAVGVPNALFICREFDEWVTPADYVEQIRERFRADIPDSKLGDDAGEYIIYIVAPDGERFIPLYKGVAIIKTDTPYEGCIEGSNAVFVRSETGTWDLVSRSRIPAG